MIPEVDVHARSRRPGERRSIYARNVVMTWSTTLEDGRLAAEWTQGLDTAAVPLCPMRACVPITPAQGDAFRKLIQPMLEFVFRCRQRLEELGFSQDNALYKATEKTYAALDELRTTLQRGDCRHPAIAGGRDCRHPAIAGDCRGLQGLQTPT